MNQLRLSFTTTVLEVLVLLQLLKSASSNLRSSSMASLSNNKLDPLVRNSLRIEFEKYDTDNNHQLSVEEFLHLTDNIHGINKKRIKKSTEYCGRHLLSTCKVIEKLRHRQTKALMLHKMCIPCEDQGLKPFPTITGHPHLPQDWMKRPLNKLINRDVVKKTGKDADGHYLTGKDYLKRLAGIKRL